MAVVVNDDAKKIIRTYSFIYTIIFVLGIPLVAFGTSIGIFVNIKANAGQGIILSDDTNKIDTVLENKLKEFDKFNSSSASSSGTQISIKVYDGPFDLKSDFLISQNNILIYKGLVLPNYVSHKLPLPTQEKAYFSKIGYSLTELSSFVDKVVLTTIDTSKFPKYERPTLLTIPNNDLVSFFSLKCLSSNKMISKICDEYTKYFLDVMFVYDLSTDSDGLKKVNDQIIGNENFNKQFCEGIYQYLKNSNYADNSLANVILSCGDQVDGLYTALKDLNIVKKDLTDITSKYVSDDKELNAYKLLSLQQLIYNEVEKRRLNQPRVGAYLQFIKELLKNDTLLEHVYLDEVFLFNNTYLSNVLKMPIFNMSAGQKETTKLLQQTIREVNIGSELEGYNGLYSKIYNKNLESVISEEALDGEIIKAEKITLRDRFNEKFTFDDLSINDVRQKGENIYVKGILKLKIGEETMKQKIPIDLVFSDYRGTFAVDSVSFDGKKTLNDVLKTIISQNKTTMPKLYDYILQNADLFLEEQEELTFCDVLSESVKGITTCSDKQVGITINSGGKNITYTFLHENGTSKDILITDKKLEQNIEDVFSGYATNSFNFSDFINEVVSYEPEVIKEEILNDISQTERTIIDSDFNKYFGVNIDGIMKQGGDILVAFDLKNIEFIASYDLKKHTINGLFFKKLGNGEQIDINMELSSSNTDDIEVFVNDPILYLQELNIRIVELYKAK